MLKWIRFLRIETGCAVEEQCPKIDETKPEDSEDHAQVVAGATEDGMQRITEAALEPVSPQTPFVLHVPDGRFNGTSSVNRLFDGWRHTTFLATAPDGDARHLNAPITFVDKDRLG